MGSGSVEFENVPLDQFAIQLHPHDNVAIAKREIPAGIRLQFRSPMGNTTYPYTFEHIPSGHKVALESIEAGQSVRRYGQFIGRATQRIQPGSWVHSHNLAVGEIRPDYTITIVQERPLSPPPKQASFRGYMRADGRAGTRNYIAVIATSNCSAHVATLIARHFTEERLEAYPNVDGVIAVTHHSGCSLPAEGTNLEYLRRTLTNLTCNPNIGGNVLVGLGCEVNQMQDYCPSLGFCTPRELEAQAARYLVIQELGGTQKTVQAGIAAVEELLPKVNLAQRERVPVARLVVGLQCGGSDSWSGLTANPLVGLVADRVVELGGTAVLAETPELFGAESLLTHRVVSEEVGQKLIRCLERWQEQAQRFHFSVDNNPTPGNKAGGLTTIFEKSLGAVAKGGHGPLRAVYEYAEQIDSSGLVLMDTPGNDPISVTGQVAGGCNLILFTTGRGSVFGGSIAPCLKIATNRLMFERMSDDLDFNGSIVLEGVAWDAAAQQLLDQVIATASGQRTKSEQSGPHDTEFVPWHLGFL